MREKRSGLCTRSLLLIQGICQERCTESYYYCRIPFSHRSQPAYFQSLFQRRHECLILGQSADHDKILIRTESRDQSANPLNHGMVVACYYLICRHFASQQIKGFRLSIYRAIVAQLWIFISCKSNVAHLALNLCRQGPQTIPSSVRCRQHIYRSRGRRLLFPFPCIE